MSKGPAELLQAYRREQILTAAAEVIREHGYEQSSVDQIAKRAGVSRSTVYEYFSSKAEILQGCFAASREILTEELARRIDRTSDLEARLTAFFEICLLQVDQYREFFLAIAFPTPVDEASASEGPGGTPFALLIKDFNDAVSRILEAGVARGELPDPVAPDLRACLGPLIIGAMGVRSRQDAPPPLPDTAARLARFALRGLGQSPA